jgi:predicted enzyme related to lactoylglutathione lyase
VLAGVDAVVVRVPDLEAGLGFYQDALGHAVLWRTDRMVGLRLGAGETELVLSLDIGPETDLLVASVDDAVAAFVAAGGSIVAKPGDIPVGRIAVVRDPFGTELTLVDLSKGRFRTDANSRVTGTSVEG